MAAVVLLLKINTKHYQDLEVACDMFVFSSSSKSAKQFVSNMEQARSRTHRPLLVVRSIRLRSNLECLNQKIIRETRGSVEIYASIDLGTRYGYGYMVTGRQDVQLPFESYKNVTQSL